MQLASEIKAQFGDYIFEVVLEPAKEIGNFEVALGETMVFSKMQKGRLPQAGEIEQLIMKRISKQ